MVEVSVRDTQQAEFLAELRAQAQKAEQQGDLVTAKARYEAILARDTNHILALQGLGRIALSVGNKDVALKIFRHLAEQAPNNVDIQNNFAALLLLQDQLVEAINVFRTVAQLAPEDPMVLSNLGVAFERMGQKEPAERCQRQALLLDHKYAPAQQRLAKLLSIKGALNEATHHFQQALAHANPTIESLSGLGDVFLRQGDVAAGINKLKQALGLQPNHPALFGNLARALLYCDQTSAQEIWQAHRQWGLRFGQSATHEVSSSIAHPALKPQALNHKAKITSEHKNRILRVGYVSPDFRQHPVASFLEPLLTHHDHSRYKIYGYAQITAIDAMTEKLRALCDGWIDTHKLNDTEAIKHIQNDQIDILVELAGLTNGNRLTLFGQRVAPIQISWLGYPATSGLETMDARITDPILSPENGIEQWTEQLIRLPRPYLAFQPPPEAPPVEPPPCLTQGRICFGSFNNYIKLSPTTLDLWADLLKQMPDSQLLLKGSGLVQSESAAPIMARFIERGIAADRVTIQSHLQSRKAHFAAYHQIDIALDPHPYNGTTTSCEALWMGVPVVTLAGELSRSRNGASLLTAIGLEEFIAHDAAQYRSIALDWAASPPRLAQLRSRLRSKMAASLLCDGADFARAMERVYYRLWHTHNSEQKT